MIGSVAAVAHGVSESRHGGQAVRIVGAGGHGNHAVFKITKAVFLGLQDVLLHPFEIREHGGGAVIEGVPGGPFPAFPLVGVPGVLDHFQRFH